MSRNLAFRSEPGLQWEMRSQWKRVRYHLEWLALLLATKLIPLLPRKACLHLARVLGALMSIFDRHRYSVALNNLEVAFGNRLSLQDRRKIARESFQHFTRTMLDLLWSPRLTRENFSRYIELENFDEITRGTGPERSFILATYHYSNFEWLSIACGYSGKTGTIVAQEFKNSLLDPIFRKIRERCGHEFISRVIRYFVEKARRRSWSTLPSRRVKARSRLIVSV